MHENGKTLAGRLFSLLINVASYCSRSSDLYSVQIKVTSDNSDLNRAFVYMRIIMNARKNEQTFKYFHIKTRYAYLEVVDHGNCQSLVLATVQRVSCAAVCENRSTL